MVRWNTLSAWWAQTWTLSHGPCGARGCQCCIVTRVIPRKCWGAQPCTAPACRQTLGSQAHEAGSVCSWQFLEHRGLVRGCGTGCAALLPRARVRLQGSRLLSHGPRQRQLVRRVHARAQPVQHLPSGESDPGPTRHKPPTKMAYMACTDPRWVPCHPHRQHARPKTDPTRRPHCACPHVINCAKSKPI